MASKNEQNLATTDENILGFKCMESVDSYQIDFNKIKTVEDCVLLMKCFITGWNRGYEPNISIYSNSLYYDQMKHLEKE